MLLKKFSEICITRFNARISIILTELNYEISQKKLPLGLI